MDRIVGGKLDVKKPFSQIIFNLFTVLLMCVPVLSIITQKYLGIETHFILIVYIITILFGIVYLTFKKKIKVPVFLWFLIPYFFYKSFVDYNYHLIYRGSFYETLRANVFIIATFFGLIMIFNSTLSKRFLKVLIRYIFLIIIIAPIFTIIQVYDPTFLRAEELWDSSNVIYYLRRYSFFGYEDPNALGFTYLPLVFAFIGTYYFQRKKKLVIFYLLCIGIVLILSNTRYIMFGFFLVFFQLILSKANKFKTFFRYTLILLVIAVLFSYVFSFIGYNFADFYSQRIDDQKNINARIISFTAFTKVFPDYLLFGIGNEKAPLIIYELHGQSPKIHVGFLNHLVVYGLAGSVLLFGFWIGLFRRLLKRARRVKYWGAVIALIFFFWANLSLVMYSIFFSGMLLALIMERAIYRERILEYETERPLV